MTVIRVKGFKIFKDRHGQPRCYHRATGTKIDLKEYPLGTEAFLGECGRITALTVGRGTPKPGTWGLLLRQYKSSPTFKDLKPATQRFYEAAFEYLRPINDTPLLRFDRPLVVRIRDKALEKRGWYFANQLKTSLSTVFAWGVERGHMHDNPAKQIKKIPRPKGMQDANPPWPDNDRMVIMSAAPGHIKAPLALMMYMGLDPCDAVDRLKSQRVNGMVDCARRKTGHQLWKPEPRVLTEILDAGRHDAITICANSNGLPWTKTGFDSSWSKFRGKLEDAGRIRRGLTLKGLRHTYATILREIGHDDRTIADALAQKQQSSARIYSHRADISEKMRQVTKDFNASERKRKREFVKPKKKSVKP